MVLLGLDMQDISREAALGLIDSTGVDYLLADADPDGTIFGDDLTGPIEEPLLSG